MTDKILAQEIALYESKKEELLENYEGQYIAINGNEIIGIFNNRSPSHARGI